jgi:hypothetical protein
MQARDGGPPPAAVNILLLEGTADLAALERRADTLQAVVSADTMIVGLGGPSPSTRRRWWFPPRGNAPECRIPLLAPAEAVALMAARTDLDAIAFLPANELCAAPPWRRLHGDPDAIIPWPVHAQFPDRSCAEPKAAVEGWMMAAGLARRVLGAMPPGPWRLSQIAPRLLSPGSGARWRSAAAEGTLPPQPFEGPSKAVSVLALIPHFGCEDWLEGAIGSLVAQTRPPDAIAVIDDGSAAPPTAACRAYPGVTLLRSGENVGPYRLIQQVIEESEFTAYLFQDADDWSCVDRIELLLAAAAQSGAELVGTQEIRVSCDGMFRPAAYPLDVNRASRRKLAHPLLHPTSLAGGALLRRIGGFSSGLRFGGDTEFLYRAVFDARIVNIPFFSYFRRDRPESLANSGKTGLRSRSRRSLLRTLHRRAASNLKLRNEGYPLDLAPMARRGPIALSHILGPRLPSRCDER